MQYPCTCSNCGKEANYEFPSGVTNRGQISPPPAGTYPLKCIKCKEIFTVQVSILVETVSSMQFATPNPTGTTKPKKGKKQ